MAKYLKGEGGGGVLNSFDDDWNNNKTLSKDARHGYACKG
jgi:hypothetical protein